MNRVLVFGVVVIVGLVVGFTAIGTGVVLRGYTQVQLLNRSFCKRVEGEVGITTKGELVIFKSFGPICLELRQKAENNTNGLSEIKWLLDGRTKGNFHKAIWCSPGQDGDCVELVYGFLRGESGYYDPRLEDTAPVPTR